MANPTAQPPARPADEPAPSWLDRRLDLTRVDPHLWIMLALLVAAALLRFWDLGARAMHHDEAIHAWMSYRFYTGAALYQYDPAFHGPLLYHITALFFFLFGDSEVTARAAQALCGLGLVALCYPLRRWLGRWGSLAAAALLAFSPAFVYFSRFARHDAFVVLLTLAAVISFFRYLEERRPRDLVLAAGALALSFASHELTFLLAFIFLSFLGLAYLLDWQAGRFQNESRIVAGCLAAMALILLLSLASAGHAAPLLQVILLVLALLGAGYCILSSAWGLFRGPSPIREAAGALTRDPRPLLTALGVFGLIFALLFTTFLSNPRGFLDGLVQGLSYWVGQHDVQRGGQPWFYYLMLLPVYEPVVLSGGVAGFVLALRSARRRDTPPAGPAGRLFPIFLAYWALLALVLFSWAGEKMPWLLLHVALPLTLLAALALDRFVGWLKSAGPALWHSGDWAAGPLFLLLALTLTGVVRLANSQVPHPLAGQYLTLQIAVLVMIGIGLIALLSWRIYRIEGRHLGQSFAALLLLLLSLYTVRGTFLFNFYHGSTPVEMLVYTQTAPDVPLVVRQIERLSIDHTRTQRTVQDPTGGHGLKIAIDTSHGAALNIPFDWYLRRFAQVGNLAYFSAAEGPPPQSDILLVLAQNEPLVRPYIQGRYSAQLLKHRWWFPEAETYRRWSLAAAGITPAGYAQMPWLSPRTYSREGLAHLWDYLSFRRLPYALGSQNFYLYVRSELLPTDSGVVPVDPYIEKLASRQAVRFLGSPGRGEGQLLAPRGMALDTAGNLYVADSGNHRIVVFDEQGRSFSWGSFCNLTTDARDGCLTPDGAGQFNDPWDVAVDGAGRVYVADTWNHRIQVFDANGRFLGQWGQGRLVDADFEPDGRPGTPYGFYGPRGLAVDEEGRVYVTDTGNERVLVYQVRQAGDGSIQADYLYQWGTIGLNPGQFLEPVGIALDAAGRVYVADTWNERVQVFAMQDGVVDPLPAQTWPVTGWSITSLENKPYLAVSPGGQVYFTVPERHYVAGTDNKGKVLAVWGGSGSDLSSFSVPIGVAVDAQGQVYVSDTGNGRVLIFTVP